MPVHLEPSHITASPCAQPVLPTSACAVSSAGFALLRSLSFFPVFS